MQSLVLHFSQKLQILQAVSVKLLAVIAVTSLQIVLAFLMVTFFRQSSWICFDTFSFGFIKLMPRLLRRRVSTNNQTVCKSQRVSLRESLVFMFGDIAFVFSISDHERCRMKLGQKEKLTLIFLPQHNAVTT